MSDRNVKAKHAFLIQNDSEVWLFYNSTDTSYKVQMLTPENVTVGLYSFPNLHSHNLQNSWVPYLIFQSNSQNNTSYVFTAGNHLEEDASDRKKNFL